MKLNLFSRLFCALLLVVSGTMAVLAQGVISTIAGTGIAGYSGDGGLAVDAELNTPAGVSADAAGNVYIADKYNHRIRRIAADGTITTVAGTGAFGYSGMGGPATLAGMEYPDAVFTDSAGNLLITDFFADCSYFMNHAAGTLTNSCGHGTQGCTGDGAMAPLATMELPHGICKDAAGNVYIADYGNNRVRKIDGVTGNVSTITGGGVFGFSPSGTLASACQFSGVNGVCADAAGNVYVSDLGNHVVRKIDLSGRVRTVAGNGVSGYSGDGGSALAATLRSPGGLFVNGSGYLFICDETSNVVRVVNLNTLVIKTLAGTGTMGFSGDGGTPAAAELNAPSAVWEQSGTIFVADMGNHRIRKITGSGYKSTSYNGVGTVAEAGFNVYPNPTSGSFTVQTTTATGTMELYNIIGEKVWNQDLSGLVTNVAPNVAPGIYNLVVKTEAGTQAKKIVVQR